ncbi:MAG: SDR family NAD(P)-dependent oxidoreductase [Pseudomonadota bacterium]
MSQRIWIIGASDGIGAALARLYAQQGHHLVLSARRGGALKKIDKTLVGSGHQCVPMDVRRPQSIEAAKTEVLSHWSRIDRVIYMAGLYQPMKMQDLDIKQTKKIIEVNLLGAFHICHALIPDLLSFSPCQLAFCASVAGYRGLPGGQPYGASKAGLINLVQSLRIECGERIDVRLINPGFVKSRLTDKNEFAMPLRLSADDAARRIIKGLEGRSFEIHFPRRFTYIMKGLGILPDLLYHKLMRPRGTT